MEILTPALLSVIMLGSTHYVDIGEAEPAVIFYEDEDTAFMRLPDGNTLVGDWRFTSNGYFVAWADGPEGEWRIGFEPGRFAYLDAGGTERGTIIRIHPGNPEGFGS